jgi:L-rhamnose 1-dehydrogenase
VNTFGRIDALVSNAGILRVEDFLELSVESWDRVMEVNLRGCFLIVQAVARQMVTQTPSSMTGQRGSVVCISSIAAIRGGSTQSGSHVHYNASKAGVISLMEGSALALGVDGIRCNSILPGECHIKARSKG